MILYLLSPLMIKTPLSVWQINWKLVKQFAESLSIPEVEKLVLKPVGIYSYNT